MPRPHKGIPSSRPARLPVPPHAARGTLSRFADARHPPPMRRMVKARRTDVRRVTVMPIAGDGRFARLVDESRALFVRIFTDREPRAYSRLLLFAPGASAAHTRALMGRPSSAGGGGSNAPATGYRPLPSAKHHLRRPGLNAVTGNDARAGGVSIRRRCIAPTQGAMDASQRRMYGTGIMIVHAVPASHIPTKMTTLPRCVAVPNLPMRAISLPPLPLVACWAPGGSRFVAGSPDGSDEVRAGVVRPCPRAGVAAQGDTSLHRRPACVDTESGTPSLCI